VHLLQVFDEMLLSVRELTRAHRLLITEETDVSIFRIYFLFVSFLFIFAGKSAVVTEGIPVCSKLITFGFSLIT
jgi:hypothetical protein